MENSHLDRIEKFILGKLTSEELNAFNIEYERDLEFSREVNLRIKSKGAIYQYGREQQHDTFKNWFEEYENAATPVRKLNSGWVKYAVAAAVAVLVAFGYFMLRPAQQMDSEALYTSFYERPRVPESLATPIDTMEIDLVTQAKGQYFKKDYTAAINSYQKILADPNAKNRSQTHLYLGICLLETGKMDNAIQSFSQANLHVDQAEWYTSLASLKKKDLPTAKKQLEAIASNSMHYYAEQAREMLKKGIF